MYVLGIGTLGVDGRWVAAINGTYSFVELDPGEHHLCMEFSTRYPAGPIPLPLVKIERASAHSLNAKAGETYYFYTRFNNRGPDFVLEQLDPDEGARMISSTTFSTSQAK
jgi:hypothetical protein